ncbi:sarcosine oxidase subunit gamma [Jannaschia sp. S6380]|uniref:sarcosine oxidase subunit gamma n=1 Tax=Jannaschia sp. S6380 TaxID=2926408 RepID=UPI001FF66491|nr:sarcosine oxidase subunit gamma family protein [Jannaschia sp. S6380]MCK0166614.1 sarcosine oxidase subunit gamma [Jannaschia sp. S6380]
MSDVTIHAVPPMGMITLRGDPSVLGPAVEQVTACAPPDRRMATVSGDRTALWMSPDEYLLVCPYDDAPGLADRLTDALGDAFATVAVVSDARQVFDLTGAGVEPTLASLMPVDFDRLARAEIRRSRLAQVPAAIWRHADGYRLVCFRSVARYAEDLLRNAAAT